MATISRFLEACLRKFSIPLTSEIIQSFAGEITLEDWENQFSRLHDWKDCADAYGVHHGPLEYRLRHVPSTAGYIVEQLDSLISGFILLDQLQMELARRAMDTKHQEDCDKEESVSGPVDDTFQIIKPEEVIADVYENGNEFIGKLFDTIKAIQGPVLHVPIDKLGTTVFKDHSLECVVNRYPKADEDVVDRLAFATSTQLCYFENLKRWHCEMRTSLYRRREIPTVLLTKAPTDCETESDPTAGSTEEIDMLTSAIPPPTTAWGLPFRCPYCAYSIIVSNKMTWIHHVLEDLLPFVCVFPKCPVPKMRYASHQVWYDHLQTHSYCQFGKDTELQCPICKEKLCKRVRWDVHLGRHLVDLAMTTLSNGMRSSDFSIELEYPADTEEHQNHLGQFPESTTHEKQSICVESF